jgi:ribulose-phosphate 3-epimerase
MVQIIPGINETDIGELVRKITVVAPQVDTIQIDIGDNTIIPSKTVVDIEAIGKAIAPFRATGTTFEAHLMVGKPRSYIAALAAAGFSRIIAHVECDDPREFLAEARTQEMEVGLAIDEGTELEVVEPFLEEIDFVLVMTVEAGASGEEFEAETIAKVKTIHRNLPDLPIEVDGGMSPDTAKLAKEAGATRIVSTSYLFKNELDFASAIAALSNG